MKLANILLPHINTGFQKIIVNIHLIELTIYLFLLEQIELVDLKFTETFVWNKLTNVCQILSKLCFVQFQQILIFNQMFFQSCRLFFQLSHIVRNQIILI